MFSSARSPSRDSIEVDRVDGYLIFLFALLSTATLFDGFDAAMLTVAAPDTRRTLGMSLAEWGVVFAITRLGMVASFFFLFFADRWGRRTLMMLTIIGFAVFNALTAFSVSKIDFTVYQFCARVFLTAEYSLAIIVIGEEFPARLRGRAIALLTSFATVGVMVIALLHPYILLEECAAGSVAAGNCIVPEGNWLHDSGQRVVAVVQRFFGLAVDGAHWRVLYILGVVPLGLVFFLRFGMRETRRFVAEQETAGGQARGVRHTLRVAYEHAKTPWQPEYRRQTLLVTLLWNCVHLVTAPAVAFWVIYAREELGFSPAVVGLIIFWGYVGGIAGHFVAGYLIDRIGRKATCAGFYMGAAVAIFLLFQGRTEGAQYFWMILTVSGFAAANTATHVYASELFPTAIRATGYGWTTNLFGRLSEVGTPFVISAFISSLGISGAVAVTAIGPILGALLVLRYAPETKGLTLEEIQHAIREGKNGDRVPARIASRAD